MKGRGRFGFAMKKDHSIPVRDSSPPAGAN
jgi:hypothetical protein